MTIERDDTAWIHESTIFAGSATIGFCSRVGHEATNEDPVRLGDGVRIGAFCLIEAAVELGEGVELDHYCGIGYGARVGAMTRVLYRAQVFDEVEIGEGCIIGGELVDRTIVGRNVTFQGETAHAHGDPTGDWDTTEEPSPVIESGSVVGVGALIIGNVRVGPRAYVAAGERVTCSVPEEMVLRDGQLRPLSEFRGLIKVRDV